MPPPPMLPASLSTIVELMIVMAPTAPTPPAPLLIAELPLIVESSTTIVPRLPAPPAPTGPLLLLIVDRTMCTPWSPVIPPLPSAVLSVTIESVILTNPSVSIAPPYPFGAVSPAWLSENTDPDALTPAGDQTPPPWPQARFPEIVEAVIVTVPAARNAPPATGVSPPDSAVESTVTAPVPSWARMPLPAHVWVIWWPAPWIVIAVALLRTARPPPPHVNTMSAPSSIVVSDASAHATRNVASSDT